MALAEPTNLMIVSIYSNPMFSVFITGIQQSDCNLSNQTAISAIRLQSPQSDCRYHATSPSTPGTDNCICKLRNFFQSAISAIKLQSQQSDCNLSNQTAISAIRLQSPQSMNRFYHVVHIGVHIPECVKHPAHCLRLQSPQSNCNLRNPTAIQTIRLQSPQSDCNLYNQ